MRRDTIFKTTMKKQAFEEESFNFPEYYSFAPFFTLQPIRATRDKQMKLWQNLILDWHKNNKNPILNVREAPVFENSQINRSLSDEGRMAVVEALIASGHAEWEDETKKRCRLFWKHPGTWAAEIYEFVTERGMINNVYTVYELHSGEDCIGTEFHGLEPWIIRRALELLESTGKAAIYPGESADEDGVKFFEI